MKRTAAVAFLVLTAACGSEKPQVGANDPDPVTCATNWQVIFSPEQNVASIPPTVLRWHDGQLFTTPELDLMNSLFSFPDTGGPATTLYQGDSWNLWIEGDRVLHASTGPAMMVGDVSVENTLLYSTPIAGGPSDVLFTTHIFDVAGDPLVEGWALDADGLYWTRSDDWKSWTLWRAGRDGSGDQSMAALPMPPKPADSTLTDGALYNTVVPAGDRLIVYNNLNLDSDQVVSVPKAGGEATLLPSWPAAQIIAVSSDGTVLTARYTGGENGQKRSEHFETGRLRPGAAAVEPFWTGKPPSALPRAAWDDGQGGFIVSAWEYGTDDALHTTIWAVDGDGNGQRLACDPVVNSTVDVAAVSPDAVFVIVRDENAIEYWQVARVGRAAPPTP
jgi:hypothetical protein